jgi:hypothetical protein
LVNPSAEASALASTVTVDSVPAVVGAVVAAGAVWAEAASACRVRPAARANGPGVKSRVMEMGLERMRIVIIS